jgi:hypothetical protein
LAKTSLFGPKKAKVKAAADYLLKTRVGHAGGPGGSQGATTSNDASTHQEEEATGSLVSHPNH